MQKKGTQLLLTLPSYWYNPITLHDLDNPPQALEEVVEDSQDDYTMEQADKDAKNSMTTTSKVAETSTTILKVDSVTKQAEMAE